MSFFNSSIGNFGSVMANLSTAFKARANASGTENAETNSMDRSQRKLDEYAPSSAATKDATNTLDEYIASSAELLSIETSNLTTVRDAEDSITTRPHGKTPSNGDIATTLTTMHKADANSVDKTQVEFSNSKIYHTPKALDEA